MKRTQKRRRLPRVKFVQLSQNDAGSGIYGESVKLPDRDEEIVKVQIRADVAVYDAVRILNRIAAAVGELWPQMVHRPDVINRRDNRSGFADAVQLPINFTWIGEID